MFLWFFDIVRMLQLLKSMLQLNTEGLLKGYLFLSDRYH